MSVTTFPVDASPFPRTSLVLTSVITDVTTNACYGFAVAPDGSTTFIPRSVVRQLRATKDDVGRTFSAPTVPNKGKDDVPFMAKMPAEWDPEAPAAELPPEDDPIIALVEAALEVVPGLKAAHTLLGGQSGQWQGVVADVLLKAIAELEQVQQDLDRLAPEE